MPKTNFLENVVYFMKLVHFNTRNTKIYLAKFCYSYVLFEKRIILRMNCSGLIIIFRLTSRQLLIPMEQKILHKVTVVD